MDFAACPHYRRKTSALYHLGARSFTFHFFLIIDDNL
uniref:Uncharacterized protein n=1 Tax=Siphoviridae sp. ctkyE7 TaxID=2827926 RepID=A0A8S5SR13_9CAUD|nr:MAG TPA: hypothetical protein [Siphoviridae sp. ctkyE7]DAJ78373.1 MAG TPA: hypothetical protein [Caudoviricetes sp.]